MRTTNVRRSLALTTALLLTTVGLGAAPALAEPGQGKGNGQHAEAAGKGKGENAKGPKGNNGKGPKGNNGNGPKGNNGNAGGNGNGNAGGNGNGNAGGNGNGNAGGNGNGNAGGNGDPAGNNGTVKITVPGPGQDGIPNNTPHPGCAVGIEWYGFDEGEDIVSTVEFAMQAPTKGVAISGTEPSQVFVGGDPATGAGTETGLDGKETYSLQFDGEPHPQQGYHVKLTVHTPRSKGADVKHKVFWVEPCETNTGSGGDDGSEDSGTEDGTDDATDGSEEETTDGEVLGTQASSDDSASDSSDSASETVSDEAATAGENVPNAVDAGDDGNPVVAAMTSPLGLLLLGCALAVGGAVLLARRATR